MTLSLGLSDRLARVAQDPLEEPPILGRQRVSDLAVLGALRKACVGLQVVLDVAPPTLHEVTGHALAVASILYGSLKRATRGAR